MQVNVKFLFYLRDFNDLSLNWQSRGRGFESHLLHFDNPYYIQIQCFRDFLFSYCTVFVRLPKFKSLNPALIQTQGHGF